MNAAVECAARFAGLDPSALAGLVPLVEAGALESVDVHVTATLAARFGASDPEALLAAALAVRAPRHGHVCVDLHGLDPATLAPEPRDGEVPARLALPEDREAWRARVAASPLVRATDDGETPFVLRGSRLYADRLHGHEARLASALLKRFAEPRPVADPALLRVGLDALFPEPAPGGIDRQRLAAAMALLRGALVISGGPGTGKTWTVRNLLTLLFAQAVAAGGARPRVALAAPTGKAAARMLESVRAGLAAHTLRAAPALGAAGPDDLAAFLTGLVPSTLHRLLGWQPHDPTRFRHHAGRPLPYDVIVVDEASMVDLALMARLVDAVSPGARLVLLGDRHQLASVEAGSVLADVCGDRGPADVRLSAEAAGVLRDLAGIDVPPTMDAPGPWDAVVFLTESRRFDAEGGIGRFAGAVIAGDVEGARAATAPPSGPVEPATAEGPRLQPELLLLPHAAGRELTSAARELVVRAWRPYLQALRADPRDPERHVRALALFEDFRILCAHREGPFGVSTVGRAAVELLRKERLVDPSEGPWWLGRPVLVTRNDYAVRRFNGDVGLVVHDAQGEPVVAFREDSGQVAYLPPARMPECETVYAMTIHKSQGSEFATVLVVLPERPSPVLTRELVYTGVTRARRRVVLVASDEVLSLGIARRVERASGLGSRLWGA